MKLSKRRKQQNNCSSVKGPLNDTYFFNLNF